ncbi:MAG: hypothetical protein ACI4C4_07625 [Lachnospiraceae bacterium]
MNSGEEYLDNLLKSMMEGESTADTVAESEEANAESLQSEANETEMPSDLMPDETEMPDDLLMDATEVSGEFPMDESETLDDLVIDETDISDDLVIDETDVPDELGIDGLTDVPSDLELEESNGAENEIEDFNLSDLGLDDLGLEEIPLTESESGDFATDDALENLLAGEGELSDGLLNDTSLDELSIEEPVQEQDAADGNMSAEEIERLLSGDLILGDEISDADESESMVSDSVPTDDLLTADDTSETDDLALEDFGESDDDLSALLEGLEQNEDLSEINDLLEKSDQGVSVDDDMLAMLESVPEGGDGENGDEAFDFFSGEEAVEGEPENIRELTQEELEEREENKGAKKEKKKREKKPRKRRGKKDAAESDSAVAEGENAALESLLEDTADEASASKKRGLFARLLDFLTEEDEEVPDNSVGSEANTDDLLLGNLTEENQQVLDDLNKEDQEKDKKKGKKEKKKKEKKAKKSKKAAAESGEDEETEGEDKEKGKKKKPKKKKKEKNPEEEVPAVPEKKLSRKKVITVFLYCATIAACIIVISRVLPNYMQKRDARVAYDNQKYGEVFDLLYGKNLSEEDELILEKSSTILQMRRKLDSYENYEKLNMPLEALDALISGVDIHQKLLPKADEYRVTDEVNEIYDQILEKLSEYGVSEADALDIIASGDNVTYSQRLESIIYGNAETSENAEETIQDVLPEEEEIIDRLEQSEEAETEQE